MKSRAAPAPSTSRPTVGQWLAVAVLPLLVLAVYAPGRSNTFTGWDDCEYIRDNPLLWLPDGLQRIWTTAEAPQYYPLTFTTHWLEYRLWGEDPTGYFVVNVALHAINTALAYFIARAVGLGFSGAWLAAAVFGLHPLQVGTVAWLAERKNVLATLFQFVTFLLYVRHRRDGVWWAYGAALLAFLLAVFSKTVVVTLLPVLWLTDWFLLRNRNWGGVWRLVPLLVVAVLPLVVTAQREQALTGVHLAAPLRPFQAAGALWFYVFKFAWPATLLAIYPRWAVSAAALIWWGALVGLVVVVAVLWRIRRRLATQVGWGLAYFALTLAPALGFVTFGFMLHAPVGDHLVYAALLGPAVVVAVAVERFAGRSPGMRAALYGLAGVWLVLLSAKTTQQVRVWRDPLTLWSHTLAYNPRSAEALIGMGTLRRECGDLAGALEYFQRAVAQRPDSAHARLNLGVALAELGRVSAAVEQYRLAADLHPEFGPIHSNLAAALLDLGSLDEAVAHGCLAVQHAPNDAAARLNLGSALAASQRYQEALEHLEFASRCEPDNPEAHLRLAEVRLALGRTRDAIEHYRKTLQLAPEHPLALVRLAAALAREGERQEAVALLRRAVQVQPTNAAATHLLARLLAAMDDAAGALSCYNRALELQRDNPQVACELAWILATHPDSAARDVQRAIALAEQAYRATGETHPAVLDTLAAAYAADSRFAEAAGVAERAVSRARAEGLTDLAAQIEARRTGYLAGQPHVHGQAANSQGAAEGAR